eukprot:1008438-Rhodomonas_salina.5
MLLPGSDDDDDDATDFVYTPPGSNPSIVLRILRVLKESILLPAVESADSFNVLKFYAFGEEVMQFLVRDLIAQVSLLGAYAYLHTFPSTDAAVRPRILMY